MLGRFITRGLCALSVLAFVTACGGGGGSSTPTPTVTLSLSGTSGAVTAGNSTTVTATIVRGGGFAGAVTIAASGAPTGVTVTGGTIAAAATTQVVTITTTAAATTGLVTLGITGTAAGVTITAASFALTVNAAPGVTLALMPTATSVAGGSTGTISAVITRINGFTGPVTIAATGVPANVIVSGGTIDAAGNTQAVTIAPALNATPGTTNVNITATATGVTIAPQPLALTVTAPASPITQLGSDITSPDAQFGSEIALSANGTRVVVSASGTANGTTRVYERTASTWNQLGADIIGEAAGDQAGTGVDINAAGTRIAIGAYLNDGAGTATGHVRLFDLVGTTWTQVGADVDGIVSPGGLGFSVALSGSGNRLIAGAPVVGGINGTARVFDLVGGAWVQAGATLSGSSEFGDAVAISSDGNTIAVAAPFVPSSGGPGSVQVYRLTAGNWAVVGNVLSGTQNGSNFGDAVSLSADGSRIAVAATADSEGGVSGGGSRAGKVQVFDLVGSTWTQVGASVLGNVGLNGENLGQALTLSDDGTRFAASGASQSVAKVYRLTGGAWVQVGANITNTQAARSEGTALSADGGTVAVGFVNGTPKRVSVFGITP